jgi:hypothetical protein
MKTILITLMGMALFAPAALAKHLHHSRGYASTVPNTSTVPDNLTPTGGRPVAPNSPREYGETSSGARVNPDRVSPLSPGGQGLAPESR